MRWRWKVEQGIGEDEERARALPGHGREGAVELVGIPHLEDAGPARRAPPPPPPPPHRSWAWKPGLAGFESTATREIRGAISMSRCERLADRVVGEGGRAR